MRDSQRKIHHDAKINGEVVDYDFCCDDRDFEKENPQLSLVYLGKGTWYSVDGALQKGEKKLHFWVKA